MQMDVAPPPAEAAGQGGGEGRPFWHLEGGERPPKRWNDTNLAFALLHNITYEYNPHKRGRAGGSVPRTREKQGLLAAEVEVYHAVAKAYRWTMNNLDKTEAKDVGGQGVRRTLLLLLKLCVALRLRDRSVLCVAKAGSIGFDCASDSVKAFQDSNWTATDCLGVRLPYPVALRQVMRDWQRVMQWPWHVVCRVVLRVYGGEVEHDTAKAEEALHQATVGFTHNIHDHHQEDAYPSTAALRALFTAHPSLHTDDPLARNLYCLLVSLYLRALAGHYQEEEVAPDYQPLQPPGGPEEVWRLPPLQPPAQEGAMVIVVEPLVVRFLAHLMVQMNAWGAAVLGDLWDFTIDVGLMQARAQALAQVQPAMAEANMDVDNVHVADAQPQPFQAFNQQPLLLPLQPQHPAAFHYQHEQPQAPPVFPPPPAPHYHHPPAPHHPPPPPPPAPVVVALRMMGLPSDSPLARFHGVYVSVPWAPQGYQWFDRLPDQILTGRAVTAHAGGQAYCQLAYLPADKAGDPRRGLHQGRMAVHATVQQAFSGGVGRPAMRVVMMGGVVVSVEEEGLPLTAEVVPQGLAQALMEQRPLLLAELMGPQAPPAWLVTWHAEAALQPLAQEPTACLNRMTAGDVAALVMAVYYWDGAHQGFVMGQQEQQPDFVQHDLPVALLPSLLGQELAHQALDLLRGERPGRFELTDLLTLANAFGQRGRLQDDAATFLRHYWPAVKTGLGAYSTTVVRSLAESRALPWQNLMGQEASGYVRLSTSLPVFDTPATGGGAQQPLPPARLVLHAYVHKPGQVGPAMTLSAEPLYFRLWPGQQQQARVELEEQALQTAAGHTSLYDLLEFIHNLGEGGQEHAAFLTSLFAMKKTDNGKYRRRSRTGSSSSGGAPRF